MRPTDKSPTFIAVTMPGVLLVAAGAHGGELVMRNLVVSSFEETFDVHPDQPKTSVSRDAPPMTEPGCGMCSQHVGSHLSEKELPCSSFAGRLLPRSLR